MPDPQKTWFAEAKESWWAMYIRPDKSIFYERVVGWRETEFGKIIPMVPPLGENCLRDVDQGCCYFVTLIKAEDFPSPTKEQLEITELLFQQGEDFRKDEEGKAQRRAAADATRVATRKKNIAEKEEKP